MRRVARSRLGRRHRLERRPPVPGAREQVRADELPASGRLRRSDHVRLHAGRQILVSPFVFSLFRTSFSDFIRLMELTSRCVIPEFDNSIERASRTCRYMTFFQLPRVPERLMTAFGGALFRWAFQRPGDVQSPETQAYLDLFQSPGESASPGAPGKPCVTLSTPRDKRGGTVSHRLPSMSSSR